MKNKKKFHQRSLHNEQYNFEMLSRETPKLTAFIIETPYGELSIDYSNANAVICLNQAILRHFYHVKDWSIPKGSLCPPVPGRADYLHYIADLLSETRKDKSFPVGTQVKGLDIGTGTSCIYPILGNSIYGWKFIGSDIDSDSINFAKKILNSNSHLKKNIKLRFQTDEKCILRNVFKTDEYFEFTMCNPPFFLSLEEATKASTRKVNNLNYNKQKKGHPPAKKLKSQSSNFGGHESELWCKGGEAAFIAQMIDESTELRDRCQWFTTLVSNIDNLPNLEDRLRGHSCTDIRSIKMHHGHKITHILAWRY